MSVLDDEMLLYRVAKYYYENDYSQSEIAKIENISRAQISRLLKKAKEKNIVRIEVTLPDISSIDIMRERIKEKYHFQEVYISPNSDQAKDNDENLYLLAASFLSKHLLKYQKIGIGWGKTLYHISLHLQDVQGQQKHLFCPLVGNSGTNNPYLQSNSITDRFSEKFHAEVFYNNLLLLENKKTLSEIAARRLEQLRELWNGLDVAVIGLGGTVVSSNLYIEELPEVFYNNKNLDHIVGDVLGDFYLDDGTFIEFPKGFEKISVTIENLKKMKEVICIAHGETKVNAIQLISKKNFISTLITDENTAKLLLK